MKNLKILIIALILNSCNNDIGFLNHEKIKFKDLPNEISQFLRNPSKYKIDLQSMLIVLPEEKKKEYKLVTVNTWIGPWVDYEKLIDLKTNISYKIEQGVPSPYIVYENYLYIPDRFNILTTVEDLNSITFTRYKLN